MRAGRFSFLLIFSVFVGGCTKAPTLPTLRGGEPSAPERVVLRDRLTPADIREVFAAINRDGKLNSLRPYFESASDGEMSAMADVLSRFFYEDAYRADSFVSLLKAESARKGFSDWAAAARRWEGRPGFHDETAGLRYVMAQGAFPKIAKRDAGFLDPDWLATTITTWQKGDAFAESKTWPAPEPITGAMTVDAMSRFLNAVPNAQLTDLVATFKGDEFGTTVLKAAAAHGKTYGAPAFEGFARGLSKMIAAGKPRNQLTTLVDFARTLDGKSDGIFSVMEEKLADPELSRQVAFFLRPPMLRALASVMQTSLDKAQTVSWPLLTSKDSKPSEAFITLFGNLRESIDSATKPALRIDGEDETDGYVARSAVYLHAYALTKWFEHIVAENREAFKKYAGWDTAIDSQGWELKLADERDEKPALTAATKAELVALGLGDFTGILENAAKGEKIRRFVYTFPALEKKSLRQAFREAVIACDDTRALVNAAPAVVALAHSLTSAESGSAFRLRDLESDALLDGINRILPKDYGTWSKLRTLLFDEIGIADLPQGLKDIVLGFYDGERLKRVTKIFDSLAVFREFDRPAAPGLPAPFAFYLRGVAFCRAEEIHAPAALLSFFSDTKFFTSDYPALFKFVKNAGVLGKIGYAVSQLPATRRDAFLQPISEAFEATEEHLALARDALPKHARGLASFFDAWSEARLSPPTDRVTREELRWLETFVKEGGFEVAWGYFVHHGSRANILGAINELKALSAKGYLQDVFDLLGHIRDERMTKLAGALKEWDSRGELVAFLDFAQTFLSDGTK